jgi:hypothetical protein
VNPSIDMPELCPRASLPNVASFHLAVPRVMEWLNDSIGIWQRMSGKLLLRDMTGSQVYAKNRGDIQSEVKYA